MNFILAIKISSDFDKVQITINYEKIKFKFVVLAIILARPDTILSIVREITRMKNAFKRIMLESTREMCKMSIDFDISYAALSFKNNIQDFIISILISNWKSSPWYSWKIAELALSNTHSLTRSNWNTPFYHFPIFL